MKIKNLLLSAVLVLTSTMFAQTQIGASIIGNIFNNSGFSVSLSSDGSIVAIGAPFSNENANNSGCVRIYRNVSGIWTQVGANINGEAADDQSGRIVSLSSDGSIVAIGARFNDGNGFNSGHVRVYRNVSGTWTQVGADINGVAINDRSGWIVSLSSDGSILAIGNYTPNPGDLGRVRVYRNVSGTWTQVGASIIGEAGSDATGLGDWNGYSVSLSSDGSIVAIGAPGNDGNGFNSGRVRVYDLSAVLSSDSFVLNNFTVYPNPTTEILNISLNTNLILKQVNIYNTIGQLLQTENKQQINISSLAKGSYFVEVITNQGKATKTMVVQ